MLNYTVMTTN